MYSERELQVQGFSTSTIESLRNYVYALQDPENGEIFYIGEGEGNRVFQHGREFENSDRETEKLNRIKKIRDRGQTEHAFIIRHGMERETAFVVEAALIDLATIQQPQPVVLRLTNIQGGHHSNEFGVKTAVEIEMENTVEELATDLPVILININNQYKSGMNESEKDELKLYEITRKAWVVGLRRNKAKYAVAVFRGVTRAAYRIDHWEKMETKRWGFVGVLAEEDVAATLVNKSAKDYFKKGSANPIKYVNCD